MNTAIAGVAVDDHEATVMTIWPSVSKYALGRLLGRLYGLRLGFYIFRLGNLIALATAPIGAVLYLLQIAPFVGTRYRITNKRILVERGLGYVEERSVNLDRFDSIEIVVRPGQEWYSSGDLVFRLGETETFHLEAVSRPESFRQVCLKSHLAYTSIQPLVEEPVEAA
jgi:hypothetical protein